MFSFTMSLLVAVVAAGEDDDPFGLPTPIDKNRPGIVMMHGGGPDGLADEIRLEFVRLAGGRDARILLMPSDECQRGKDEDGKPLRTSETIEEYERRCSLPERYGRWPAMRDTGQVADFQFLYRSPEDQDDSRFYALLAKATGVWLPAYDQAWLPSQLASEYPNKISRFQLALRDVLARGGVVGGLGGGMSSLPETIIAEDDIGESGWVRAKLRFGLALFSGAVVDQNFDYHAGRLERMTDLLRNGARLDRLDSVPGQERRTIGLGVERNTAMILQAGTIRVIGERDGHIFLKGNGDRTITWRKVSPGEEPIVLRSSSQNLHRKLKSSAQSPSGLFNPLGVPEPINPARIGTVILHGGGYTGEIIDLMPKLAGVAKPRLVHCPTAGEKYRPEGSTVSAELASRLESSFAVWRQLQRDGLLEDLTFRTTGTPESANNADFVRPLTQADALWFSGGDQKYLADLYVDRLRPTLFQQEVLNIVRRGGAVGGVSAGLAIMADVMIESGLPENGKPAEAQLSRGLGVLKHAFAEQHFDAYSGRIERLTGLLRNHRRLANFSPTSQPSKMVGLAVEEDTALIVQMNRLYVTGKKLAHIFLQSPDPRVVAWHALKPGDAAVLLPGPEGYVLQLEDWEFAD